MNELQVFQNSKFGDLEILIIEGKEWFPAIQVAETLGYSNPHKAVKDHTKERGVTIRSVIDKLGRKQNKKFIDEGNLYRLITRSKLPQADEFEEWVFEDVLPSIRKHGLYATDNVIEQTIQNPDYIIHVLTEFKKEREGRLVAEQQVNELKPKATYYDLVLQNKSLLSVSKIAKDYGMSARSLNKLLHSLGVQYKQGDIWLLYAKYQDKGYTHTSTYALDEEHSKVTTKWTQKGRLFIYDLLKDNDILPTIEQAN
ncbi:phage antirepressor [Staphylococcus epidermidis]|uniref:phage antirepressor n=1 Tax=Staphylococcus epidermidis TaxID=1282 RepID=UPI00026C1F4A|nr:phage antirepressor KilAC domain-containing protein [Staphylococcus epidermidis]EJE08193.1 toxin-antitoxin system, toxin component, Bro family [Staphylococcus epidermidis NIHLM021]MDS3967128.1 phage antirepressor KilAC domain-containing protein [Staphylococcus epidermidis]